MDDELKREIDDIRGSIDDLKGKHEDLREDVADFKIKVVEMHGSIEKKISWFGGVMSCLVGLGVVIGLAIAGIQAYAAINPPTPVYSSLK